MTCKLCRRTPHRIVRSYPAGDTRASLRAAHDAQEQRERGEQAHVHYAADGDQFVVAAAAGGESR
ncbi:hypothetical protein [Streptomyces daliensis]